MDVRWYKFHTNLLWGRDICLVKKKKKKKYVIDPCGNIDLLHLTHHIHTHTRRSWQLKCSTQGPTPVLLPVAWSGALTGVLTLTYMLMVGGNWSTQQKPKQTQRQHANSTQKGPLTAVVQTQDLPAVRQQC